MNLQDYLKLRNETDVRGVVDDSVENEPITLTTEAVETIAKAFCVWLISRTGKIKVTVAVGHDSRLSASALCSAAVKGITSTGHNALVTGLSTTPSMFMLLHDDKQREAYGCDGSIMLTASHLPSNRNGMKFFLPTGGLESSDIKDILTIAANFRFADPGQAGCVFEKSYIDDYSDFLVKRVRAQTGSEKPLLGKRIIVDAGNGAGGFFVEKVLQPLGADTLGSQFLHPDGNFPNHIPNPENKQAIASICNAVTAAKADLGIIFDTDVDRAGAVDKNGQEINRNRLIALISAILLAEKPGTIVTDSVTSNGLAKFIQAKGGKHHRFKRGYKNVINEALRLNRQGEYSPLAIETSGHAALMENYFLDDGAYLIVRLLIAMANAAKEGKELTDCIAELAVPAEEMELRVRINGEEDFKRLGRQVIDDFTDYAKKTCYISPVPENYEGIRVDYDNAHGNGWALLRMSLHDPVLPINVESDSEGGVLKIVKDIYYFLKKYDFLDLSAFEKYIQAARTAAFQKAKDNLRNAKKRLY